MKCYRQCTFENNGISESSQTRYSSISTSNKKNEFCGINSALEDVLGGNSDGFKASYFGTSGHSGHKRAFEHLNALRKENTSYAITKHYKN